MASEEMTMAVMTRNDGLQIVCVLYVPGTAVSSLKIVPLLISPATKWCQQLYYRYFMYEDTEAQVS